MKRNFVLSTGIDLVEIQRFEDAVCRHGDRLLSRIFTQEEILETDRHISSLAARFAAKEAVSKALGTGIGPVSWKEIEILRDSTHRPTLHLHGNAAKFATAQNLTHWSISLSHSQTHAIAMATAIGDILII